VSLKFEMRGKVFETRQKGNACPPLLAGDRAETKVVEGRRSSGLFLQREEGRSRIRVCYIMCGSFCLLCKSTYLSC
jgi:hypothetical protein